MTTLAIQNKTTSQQNLTAYWPIVRTHDLSAITRAYQFRLSLPQRAQVRQESIIREFTPNEWNEQQTNISVYYQNSMGFAQFAQEKSWVAPLYVAYLISTGILKGKKLNILDIGCHHGNLLDALDQITYFEIQEYDGIDISKQAIEIAKNKHAEFNFTHGDALEEITYHNIADNSKNLIVCSGILDYFPPSKIRKLLSIIENKLSFDEDARIYLTYRTIFPTYGLEDPKPRRLSRTATYLAEEGITFYGFPDPDLDNLTLFNYHPDDIKKIVESHGLEIVEENSLSSPSAPKVLGSDYDYICLKRKSTY